MCAVPILLCMFRGIWQRDSELSDVTGKEVLSVTFQGAMLIFLEKVYVMLVEVLLCLQTVQWHI